MRSWLTKIAVAVVLGGFYLLGGSYLANAQEEVKSPTVQVTVPIMCMDRTALLNGIARAGGYPVWHGVRNNTFLSTLYLNADGSWAITEERAMSKTMCILASGDKNELLGIGGI